ncbi:unnamed protein product [Rotaria sp. Silwood2]|nr:unnamed protein product [Rotaria sp. Silwood2]
MQREDSNLSFRLSPSRTSLDSGVSNQSNHNECESASIYPLKSLENECVSKIIQVLELDDSIDSEIIAKQLMIKGRQALRDFEQDVSRNIFKKQMTNEQSELLEIVKAYVKQQWKEMITEEWFLKFLRQQTLESTVVYDEILTRTAEYGSKFIKDNLLLSLTLQFLFEFDNETMDNDDLFNQIWNTLITEGRQGIQHYKEYISAKVLNEQLENDQSPLYLALRDYFERPLKNLFKQKEVSISNPETLRTALDCVARSGWSNGLHDEKVTDSIAPKKFKILIGKLTEYLKSQGLSIPDESSSNEKLRHKSEEIRMLIESSFPTQRGTTTSDSAPGKADLTDTRNIQISFQGVISEIILVSSNSYNNENSNHFLLIKISAVNKSDEIQ